ncbi:MAG: polyprenyl synthetase family protein [bacterium]
MTPTDVDPMTSGAPPVADGVPAPQPPTVPGLALVQHELDRVQQRLDTIAEGAQAPLPEITAHLIGGGGKRVRPLVLLLSAAESSVPGDSQISLACAAELLHSATLLHDDVVDEAAQRRGKPVAQSVWGNSLAVLAGDHCLSLALTEIAEVGELRPVKTLAATLGVMAEGEVIQLGNRNRLNLSLDVYFDVVDRKTASLMAWCARVGGLLPPEVDRAMGVYGRAVGMAFQIADDILDYQGDAAVTGKEIGTDLREGKPTLPLIEACRLVPGLAQRLRGLDATGGNGLAREIVTTVLQCGAIESTREMALAAAGRARDALAPLSRSPFRDALADLAVYSADRVA